MNSVTPSWERPGSRVFEYVVVGPLPIAVFIILGFALEGSLEETLPRTLRVSAGAVTWGLVALLYVGTWAAVRVIQGRSPHFLATPPTYSAGEALLPILLWSMTAYVAVGVVLGLVTFVLVPKTDHHWPLIVFGFAVWVPAFFAIPTGSVVAWRRLWRET
jgi:hypothetical protein